MYRKDEGPKTDSCVARLTKNVFLGLVHLILKGLA